MYRKPNGTIKIYPVLDIFELGYIATFGTIGQHKVFTGGLLWMKKQPMEIES